MAAPLCNRERKFLEPSAQREPGHTFAGTGSILLEAIDNTIDEMHFSP